MRQDAEQTAGRRKGYCGCLCPLYDRRERVIAGLNKALQAEGRASHTKDDLVTVTQKLFLRS